MKTKIWIFTFSMLASFILVSCNNKPYTEEQDGKTIELALDSRFQIQLEGNEDTGFVWKTVGLNRNILEQISEPVVIRSKDNGKGKNTFTFTFKTIGAGNTFLRLIYYNKHQEDPKPVKDFEIRVISGTMGEIER